MRLDDQGESQNVEDRRGDGGGGGIGRGSVGIGTLVIALAAGYFFGIGPAVILGLASNTSSSAPPPASRPAHKPPANDEMATFVAKVLGSTETTWQSIFSDAGRRYQDPKLVLFTGATPTACGTGQSAMGPFYCPADHKVYICLLYTSRCV